MSKLRLDCYEEFAKRIEYPVVILEADTGIVQSMNYEAKLILGQKTQKLEIKLEALADSDRFWVQLHDRKAMVEHHIVLSNENKEYAVAGLVNEFEMNGTRMYMLLFDVRTGLGKNTWLLERIIENSHTVIAHISCENQKEIKLNYISRNIKRYGYTSDEFYMGKLQFKDMIHPDDLDAVYGSLEECAKKHIDDDCMEYRLVTESRKVCYVRCNVHFVRNTTGVITSMEMLMVDVTGEKLEKDENQYLRVAIEQSNSVVLVKRFLNKKGTVKYVSSNAAAMGIDVEALQKGRKLFTDYVLPEDRDMINGILMNAQKIPVSNYVNKCRIQGEDGCIRWVKFCISVKTLDEYMYDVELLMNDVTEESCHEENLLQNQKALEEKLDYVMTGQAQKPDQLLEEFLTMEEMQEFLEAFAMNNQLYAVVVNAKGKRLSNPAGPMIRMGEFYDMLENPKYRGKIDEALRVSEERKRFCVLELEDNYFEKQLGAIPMVIRDRVAANCLVCAFDEEGVTRLHNSIESLQKMIEIMVKAGFDNHYLEVDSRKSRLAERTMSEELEGQLILARAFAHMRNDASATVQEIIQKACELLHLSSGAVYYGSNGEGVYTCMEKWAAEEAVRNGYPEQSFRMAELCQQNEVLANGGYIIYEPKAAQPQMEYMMTQTQSRSMIIFGLVVNDEIYGGMIFGSQDKRLFLEREISYCQDVVDIIQGILTRKQNTHNSYALNRSLMNAYNFVTECVFIKDAQTGKVLFANEATETVFGMDITGMDSRAFLSEPIPVYTREGVLPVGDIKWQGYIQKINKIMDIQELSIEWTNGEDARIVIMREKA